VTTDSAKKACIFCNGQLSKSANVKQIANDCDLLIAADGGARYFLDIRNEMKALDLTTIRCAGQPELSPDPGIEPISLAAEPAFQKFYNS